jgi:RimJ/RimL family protein N-acetyltransferase
MVRTMMTEIDIRDEGDCISFAVVLPASGSVIGEVSLVLRSTEHGGGEIGYALHPDHHGRGFATEAANEMLRLGFDEYGLHRIMAKCSALNTASARLMERLGMRREGHLVGVRRFKGRWRDELVYAILADEWRLRRSR